MEIDQYQFRQQLLPLLTHISNAKFVTFDFEMSGITSKPRNAGDRTNDTGKRTLQQHYEEMKAVAETFQVLQVGICCVEEDLDREYYLARPYNFFLSPLQANGIEFRMDRRFEFSSSACDFLNKNNFDFGKVFSSGVPYLSRHEEVEIRKKEAERADRDSKISDIILQPGSPELTFYRAARATISTWVNDPKPDRSWVNIDADGKDLNGFQRRLIHQLVRAEFPGFRTFSKLNGAFMQIVKSDAEEEIKRQKYQMERTNGKISKQIGLRWIFEALSNGDLSDIPVSWFSDDDSELPEKREAAIKPVFETLKGRLSEKDHILVGHNLFTDLLFLYKTFFGPLPDKVTDFQELIHCLFPTVFDTKYIDTEGDHNSMSGRGGLKEILKPFLKVHTPLILLHEEHTSYGSSMGKDHEAGFDSWMTAELFVKLTSKLAADRKHLLRDHDEVSDVSEPACQSYQLSSSSDDSDPGGAPLIDFSDHEPKAADNTEDNPTSMGDHLPPAWHERQLQLNGGKNRFATLIDLGDDLPDEPRSPQPKQWIPEWDRSFWDIYVNKLRVNAAESGVCDLDGDEVD